MVEAIIGYVNHLSKTAILDYSCIPSDSLHPRKASLPWQGKSYLHSLKVKLESSGLFERRHMAISIS